MRWAIGFVLATIGCYGTERSYVRDVPPKADAFRIDTTSGQVDLPKGSIVHIGAGAVGAAVSALLGGLI